MRSAVFRRGSCLFPFVILFPFRPPLCVTTLDPLGVCVMAFVGQWFQSFFFCLPPKKGTEKARKTFLVGCSFFLPFHSRKNLKPLVFPQLFSLRITSWNNPKHQPCFLPFSCFHRQKLGSDLKNFDLTPLLPLCMPQTHLLFFCQTSDTKFLGRFWDSRVAVLFSPNTVFSFVCLMEDDGEKKKHFPTQQTYVEKKTFLFFLFHDFKTLPARPHHTVCVCATPSHFCFSCDSDIDFYFSPSGHATTGHWSLSLLPLLFTCVVSFTPDTHL